MYIFYLYSRLAVFHFSRAARSFVSGAFGLCYARIDVRAPDGGDLEEGGGEEKELPFPLSQRGVNICMICENTEAHNGAARRCRVLEHFRIRGYTDWITKRGISPYAILRTRL